MHNEEFLLSTILPDFDLLAFTFSPPLGRYNRGKASKNYTVRSNNKILLSHHRSIIRVVSLAQYPPNIQHLTKGNNHHRDYL